MYQWLLAVLRALRDAARQAPAPAPALSPAPRPDPPPRKKPPPSVLSPVEDPEEIPAKRLKTECVSGASKGPEELSVAAKLPPEATSRSQETEERDDFFSESEDEVVYISSDSSFVASAEDEDITECDEMPCDTNPCLTEETPSSLCKRAPYRSYYTLPEDSRGRGKRERRAASVGQHEAEVPQGKLFQLHVTPVLSKDLFFVDREPVPCLEKPAGDLAPLTEAMESEVSAAFDSGGPEDILSRAFKLTVNREDICTLQPLGWLNDRIMNFYMSLLVERSKKQGYPAVYAFNTFFYSKLSSTSHKGVKKWTKGVDIFEHDIILVPIHLRTHWTLLEIPQQNNGNDCGVFVCKFADFISRDKPIIFTPEHMPYFRRKMVWEIIHQQLLGDMHC
ncbi:hypothetical protein DUI87_21432 [Hirundo rustica rustica]|uniref:Ubiquitin-like protease family profile domain-containing protein n=1 Tax=Hirundo rustica rustica TaxID=333673 RepID=A0A3M0JNG9_HIRRU|nr:hypothetical protein DUI87_21432 [Hirundo rustica rustica]